MVKQTLSRQTNFRPGLFFFQGRPGRKKVILLIFVVEVLYSKSIELCTNIYSHLVIEYKIEKKHKWSFSLVLVVKDLEEINYEMVNVCKVVTVA